ncbi:unnamed protein product [Calicophoron daubneyi]|uniref:START domain-containing protein n=1 Tax=Calicophoron daubneyi TaxID=300641 RepID=A0AAV2TX45_CALDB
MSAFKLGEVRPPTAADFAYFRSMARDDTGWKKHHGKKRCRVFTRSTDVTSFKMIKVVANNPKVPAQVLYDTLHDNSYRPIWDKTMKESYGICRVSPDSVIEYYGLKSPFTFANRDFVLYRAWRIEGDEYIIFNRSVFHKKVPPKAGFVRALTYLTGYVITSTGPNSCELIYITQTDPRGDIPAWALNLATTKWAPSLLKGFFKAACNYPAWKATHDPNDRLWYITDRDPGNLPMVQMGDILKEPDYARSKVVENVNEVEATQEAAHYSEDEEI